MTLAHRCRIGKREEKLRAQNSPLASLWVVDLNCRKSIFSVIASKYKYLASTDGGSESTARSVKSFYLLPFFPKDVIRLAACHSLTFSIVATDHVDFPIQVDT